MSEERKKRGWGSPLIYPTGLFIREYLTTHGEGYAQEMWRKLKESRRMAFGKKRPHVCSYDSFKRNYIYVLKKLGLIEKVREETNPTNPVWHKRVYYRIVKGKEGVVPGEFVSDIWENPQKEFRLKQYKYYRRKNELAKHKETQPFGEKGTSETKE